MARARARGRGPGSGSGSGSGRWLSCRQPLRCDDMDAGVLRADMDAGVPGVARPGVPRADSGAALHGVASPGRGVDADLE